MVQKNCVKKRKIVIISGATAVGKTTLSVRAAKEFNGEIISVDSMQIYKRLNIGTGKITEEEKGGIKHYLIDIKNPDEEYSVSDFVSDAEIAIKEINSKGKLPILVGGTGLYINALLNNYSFANAPKSENIRNRLKTELEEKGSEALYNKLKKIDALATEKISVNDTKRVIRALEIFELTGAIKSDVLDSFNDSKYDYLFFVLDEDRNELYKKINQRVDKMMQLGLLDEVESLLNFKNCQSMQAIGYKELASYLDGQFFDLNQAVEKIKQNTRRYAKRQLTYFRWLKADKIWINKENDTKILANIADFK